MSSESTYSKDWRLLKFLSESELKKHIVDGSAEIDIPGILGGSGDYSDVKETLSKMEQSHDERLTEHQATNMFWTGIDDNTRIAYIACLKQYSTGLLLAPRLATREMLELLLSYDPVNQNSPPLQLRWKGDISGLKLPDSIKPFEKIVIIVPRPASNKERLIALSGGTASESLIVTALPEPANPPQAFQQVQVQLIGDGGTEDLGNGIKISEILYESVAETRPHAAKFKFLLSMPGNSDRKEFVVDQSIPWQKQVRRYPTRSGLLEMTFHGYNDGVGTLIYRFW